MKWFWFRSTQTFRTFEIGLTPETLGTKFVEVETKKKLSVAVIGQLFKCRNPIGEKICWSTLTERELTRDINILEKPSKMGKT